MLFCVRIQLCTQIFTTVLVYLWPECIILYCISLMWWIPERHLVVITLLQYSSLTFLEKECYEVEVQNGIQTDDIYIERCIVTFQDFPNDVAFSALMICSNVYTFVTMLTMCVIYVSAGFFFACLWTTFHATFGSDFS